MTVAFISYQTEDKLLAGQVKEILNKSGIDTFLAHEDIEVSEQWRLEILKQIRKARIFVALITKNYLDSIWCLQEAGISASRTSMTTICLLLDETTPPGFLQAVQGKKCRDMKIYLGDMLPGLMKVEPELMLDRIISNIKGASSFRGAEAHYKEIMPHINKLSNLQAANLLEAGFENGQVKNASLCAREYIPKVLKLFGHTISKETREDIEKVCIEYQS